MEQHPVPQAITTYKFKLVGDMTLKQFLELASGIVIAWILFSSKTNFLIKWTLGPFFAFFGFALAFVPVEDRPLDQWIINFIKAVYSPTQFLYRPQPKTLDIFSATKPRPMETKTPSVSPEKLEEYLQTLPPSVSSAFDKAEQNYLEHIYNLFNALGVSPKKPIAADTSKPAPSLKTSIKGVRVRKLMHPQMCLLSRDAVLRDLSHPAVFSSPSEPKQAVMPVYSPAPPAPKPIAKPKPVPPKIVKIVKPAIKSQPLTQTVFAPGITLPHTPDKPNLIAGITLDKAGRIIPNVILEIKNHQGQPVRALKSNKLGQFFIATPLEDGIYQLEADALDHRFAIMKLEAKGEVIPPLKIQSL